MFNIPELKKFSKITKINLGWSLDEKFYLENSDGDKFLLRISDLSILDRKKEEYNFLKEISKLGFLMNEPVSFGISLDDNKVYMILKWVEGFQAKDKIFLLDKRKQYDLGTKSGRILKRIHSLPVKKNLINWEERYNQKTDKKIYYFKECGIEIPFQNKILDYIEENRSLLKNREQTFNHGDYHVGNMIISPENDLGIIDFNRFDFGDPWDEFNRIIWSAQSSELFASGQINGYFDNEVPEKFFRLLAFYMAVNSLASIPWALKFGNQEIKIMMNNINYMLDTYDNFESYIPNWYIEKI